MSESEDKNNEEFLSIFELNGLAEILDPDLTIKDLQEGLSNLCIITSYISSFLVDYYEAYSENDMQNAPRMQVDHVASLVSLLKESEVFISLIDEDEDDEDDDGE